MRVKLTIAFLLGVASSLVAVDVFRPSQPTYADAIQSGGFVAVAGNAQPGSKDLLWLVDAKSDTPHLVCYQLDQGRLQIAAARNIRYDFMLDVWPVNGQPQSPTVKEVFDITKPSTPKGGGGGGAGGATPPGGSTAGGSSSSPDKPK